MPRNVVILFLLSYQKIVECIICYYYPQYPSQNLVLSTFCNYGCKINATTAKNACSGSEASLWWIIFPCLGLFVVFSFLGIFLKTKGPKKLFSSLPSCLKIKLPKLRKNRSISQSQNTTVANPIRNISNESNTQQIRPVINTEKTRYKTNNEDNSFETNEIDRQNTPPPRYKDLILPELRETNHTVPEIEFPMPVLPESVNETNLRK